MDNVKDIMIAFNEALEERNFYVMADCIIAMKKISPEFVDLMMNCLEDEEDRNELQMNVNMAEYYREEQRQVDELTIKLIEALQKDDKKEVGRIFDEFFELNREDRAKYIIEKFKRGEY